MKTSRPTLLLLCLSLVACEGRSPVSLGSGSRTGNNQARDAGAASAPDATPPATDAGTPAADTGVMPPIDAGMPEIDLAIDWPGPMSPPVRQGDTITVDLVVTNMGNTLAPTTDLVVTFAEDAAAAPPVTLASASVPALAAGASHSQSFTVMVPSQTTTAFEIRAIVDAQMAIEESFEQNNSIARMFSLVSEVTATPNPVDFGSVTAGCSATETLTISNTGSVDVTLAGMTIMSPTGEFSLAPQTALPVVIRPGETLSTDVNFTPASPGVRNGSVVFSFVSAQTVTVGLSGEGTQGQPVQDSASQNARPKADLLLVVDDSCSMAEEQGRLAQQWGAFEQVAINNQLDYQIGVTTTDVPSVGGSLVGSPAIITDMTPNAGQVFASNVTVGTNGSGFEQGLEASRLALTNSTAGGTAGGFVRSDASLAVVYVSDEPDGSPDTAMNYATQLSALKPPGMFLVNAIISDDPNGCTGQTGSASYGDGYHDLVLATGGSVADICGATWHHALTTLPGNFGLQTVFGLSRSPDPNTIVVEVNAATVSGWQYDGTTNSVVFDANSVPPAGATINIIYVPISC